ncbi:hypothetical protein CsSME_00037965 [Camellia sinensis var. sinensis]
MFGNYDPETCKFMPIKPSWGSKVGGRFASGWLQWGGKVIGEGELALQCGKEGSTGNKVGLKNGVKKKISNLEVGYKRRLGFEEIRKNYKSVILSQNIYKFIKVL